MPHELELQEHVPQRPPSPDAQRFRAVHAGTEEFVLKLATVTVQLLSDARRARYTFECLVTGVGRSCADCWEYDIPGIAGDMGELRAHDGAGSLQTEMQPNGHATRLVIRFRTPLGPGQSYRFAYHYETVLPAVVARAITSQTVTYYGWAIFLIPCEHLVVDIRLPRRASLVDAVPPVQALAGASGGALRLDAVRLRALETFTWLVGYQKPKVGVQFYLWVASTLGAALLGWGVEKLLGRVAS